MIILADKEVCIDGIDRNTAADLKFFINTKLMREAARINEQGHVCMNEIARDLVLDIVSSRRGRLDQFFSMLSRAE